MKFSDGIEFITAVFITAAVILIMVFLVTERSFKEKHARELHGVGIERIDYHETISAVNGNQTVITNWYEIIWMK